MPQTMMGVVYGTANPHVRQHIYPSDDSELSSCPVGPGEKLITIPYSAMGVTVVNNGPLVQTVGSDPLTHLTNINNAVCTDAGVSQLINMRFAEIDDTNTVIAIHLGDAALYGGNNTYVNCDVSIGIGHTYSPSTNEFTIPQQTLPPKTGVRASAVVVPAQTVPAGCTAVAFTKSSGTSV